MKEEEVIEIESHMFLSEIIYGVEPFFFDINSDGLLDILISQTESILVILQSIDPVTNEKHFNDI